MLSKPQLPIGFIQVIQKLKQLMMRLSCNGDNDDFLKSAMVLKNCKLCPSMVPILMHISVLVHIEVLFEENTDRRKGPAVLLIIGSLKEYLLGRNKTVEEEEVVLSGMRECLLPAETAGLWDFYSVLLRKLPSLQSSTSSGMSPGNFLSCSVLLGCHQRVAAAGKEVPPEEVMSSLNLLTVKDFLHIKETDLDGSLLALLLGLCVTCLSLPSVAENTSSLLLMKEEAVVDFTSSLSQIKEGEEGEGFLSLLLGKLPEGELRRLAGGGVPYFLMTARQRLVPTEFQRVCEEVQKLVEAAMDPSNLPDLAASPTRCGHMVVTAFLAGRFDLGGGLLTVMNNTTLLSGENKVVCINVVKCVLQTCAWDMNSFTSLFWSLERHIAPLYLEMRCAEVLDRQVHRLHQLYNFWKLSSFTESSTEEGISLLRFYHLYDEQSFLSFWNNTPRQHFYRDKLLNWMTDIARSHRLQIDTQVRILLHICSDQEMRVVLAELNLPQLPPLPVRKVLLVLLQQIGGGRPGLQQDLLSIVATCVLKQPLLFDEVVKRELRQCLLINKGEGEGMRGWEGMRGGVLYQLLHFLKETFTVHNLQQLLDAVEGEEEEVAVHTSLENLLMSPSNLGETVVMFSEGGGSRLGDLFSVIMAGLRSDPSQVWQVTSALGGAVTGDTFRGGVLHREGLGYHLILLMIYLRSSWRGGDIDGRGVADKLWGTLQSATTSFSSNSKVVSPLFNAAEMCIHFTVENVPVD